MRLIWPLLCIELLAGCVTPTTYTKSVTVHKDADGKILGIDTTEAVVQPNQYGRPLKLEYLKDVQP